MEHDKKIIQQETVYYSDTDAYGVVWHGSYLRWLEKGRVLFCESKGLKLSALEKDDIILPVIEMNIKYKQSAHLEDNITVETEIIDTARFYLTFKQVIKKNETILIEAIVKIAAIKKDGTLYRSLPEQVLNLAK